VGLTSALISAVPRLLAMEIIEREKSTLRLSPKIPESVAGLFNLVEEIGTYLYLLGVTLVKEFLAQQRMNFAMAKLSIP
jgi:hypothetical protein